LFFSSLLGTLAIVDGFNTGGSHTCNFAYDDVLRLVTDNCGTPWSQTFSYDQYNNLTKAGNSAWNPGYNTKNQYSSIGATYDASGNLTSDGTTNYTWDGYGKMLSFGSYGILYDALGRAVENNSGGSSPYGLYLMSPIGKTALLQSSPLSVVDSTIPLPGGGALSLNGTSMSYLHSDWLATKRVKSSVPATGNGTVLFDTASAPYGETYLTFGSSPLDTFTGDASWLSSQVSDTPNREYRMGQGRWLSPDPAGAGWNAYAYGTDPNTQTDPSGLMIWPGEMNFGQMRIGNNTDAASMWMVNFQQWLYFASVHADDANRANAEAWYAAKYAELRDYNHSLFQHDAEGFAIRPQNLQYDSSTDAAKSSAQEAGDVSSAKIGGVWVNAYGGTAAQRTAELAAFSEDLTVSDRGKAMLSALEGRKSGLFGLWGSPIPFDIVQIASGGSRSPAPGQVIKLDYHDVGAAYTSASGGGTYSLQRIFAHELGHAAMGNLDNGPGQMNNINWNENLIMRQLGDFNDRTSY
jgi:RHS repeat-associated protein